MVATVAALVVGKSILIAKAILILRRFDRWLKTQPTLRLVFANTGWLLDQRCFRFAFSPSMRNPLN
jgi:hypothetical protein